MTFVFITGGVRSGKSAFAEQYVRKLKANRYVYLATGVATDEEMGKRIKKHQEDRQMSKESWFTIEAPYSIPEAINQIQHGDVVLWDCLTTWLTNCFYEGFESGKPCVEREGCVAKKITEMQAAITKLVDMNIPLIVVSNELQDELPYENTEIELYREYLGKLHQWFVQQATEAYELDYGIKKKWK